MKYRALGKTGLLVSEIGLGCEWLERHSAEECRDVILRCEEAGVNILDCWMPGPEIRTNIGRAVRGRRERWIIQGHIGSTWQNGQYVRTRDLDKVKPAFEDLLARLETGYIDLGMIHYVDKKEDFDRIFAGPFLEYVRDLKDGGMIRHIGMSTHNPGIARLAVESGIVEMLLFSVNPAFDMVPSSEDIEAYFSETYDEAFGGIDPERAALYRLAEQKGVGITVMKGDAGGRLFDPARSPFGVTLTPVQCLHYALTRPAVASVLVGAETVDQVDEAVAYETAGDGEKDYASVLAAAPAHAYRNECTYCGHCKPCPMDIDIAMVNKLYDLASMQEEVPASIREHYAALGANASDCIGCGGCETRCPFGVKVTERMEKTRELFGA